MKKDFMERIAETYSVMTGSEKRLSDYIITNYDHAISLSVHALAKEVDLSVATVVRFAQHLGFGGYKEFRLCLAGLRNEHEDFVLDLDGEGTEDSEISKMLSSCAECLVMTQKNLDYQLISELAKIMHNARRIIFFGVGTSYIVCQDAEMKFKRIGLEASSAFDKHTASALLLNIEKGDVVFGVSHSGNNEFVESTLAIAKSKGGTAVAVTTFKNSRVCTVADHVLYTQTRESPLHRTAITSRVGQFAVMDSLFMAYLTAYYDTSLVKLDAIYEISNSLKD